MRRLLTGLLSFGLLVCASAAWAQSDGNLPATRAPSLQHEEASISQWLMRQECGARQRILRPDEALANDRGHRAMRASRSRHA